MQILEEFWYGNINPMERPFQRQRKFDKVFRLLTKNEEGLLKNLNEQEKEYYYRIICLALKSSTIDLKSHERYKSETKEIRYYLKGKLV
mgnify:CR=1 FL=1